MTRVQWDSLGARTFQAGCDRGVLYLPDGSIVPWSGLTSVTEDSSDVTVDEYFLDGVKYLNRYVPGDYAGTLKALTYPDEFAQFDGAVEYEEGIFATGQPVNQTFGLSYRTLLGNDSGGTGFGYRIHLLYNLTAKADTKTFNSLGATTTPEEFSWALSGIPITIPGLRPTVHIFLDSTRVIPGGMAFLEDYLYGNDDGNGQLPDPITLGLMYADLITEPITDPI